MRLLVTGASGLIGTHLLEAARAEGVLVRGLDVRPPKMAEQRELMEQVDLLSPWALRDAVTRFAPTHVVHLAARTDLLGKRLSDYDANITGVRNLVSIVKETSSVERAIYASTQLVCRRGYVPIHDEDYSPGNFYGESKVHTERIVRREAAKPWCIVRPTTIWGPHMSQHYQRFLRMLRHGLYFHLGDAAQLKSYGYVGNTAYQLLRLLEAPADRIDGKTFYLADYEPLSLPVWADELSEFLAGRRIKKVPLRLARAAAGVGDQIVRLGWSGFPFTTFRLDNVLTDNVFDMNPLRDVVPDLPYSRRHGVERTARWYLEEVEGQRTSVVRNASDVS